MDHVHQVKKFHEAEVNNQEVKSEKKKEVGVRKVKEDHSQKALDHQEKVEVGLNRKEDQGVEVINVEIDQNQVAEIGDAVGAEAVEEDQGQDQIDVVGIVGVETEGEVIAVIEGGVIVEEVEVVVVAVEVATETIEVGGLQVL